MFKKNNLQETEEPLADELLQTTEEEQAEKLATDDNPTAENAEAGAQVVSENEEPNGAQKVMAELTEDDDEEHLNWTFGRILGGDIFSASWFKRQVKFFVLVILMIIAYITNRYASQAAMIKIDNLEKELTEIRFESITRSSQLMQRTRESKVLEYLKTTGDSTLTIPTQPPFVLKLDMDNE